MQNGNGSEATGWTGRGELNMNFLKIGANPVIEIPLAVKFENMHLNQCYQILPGSKVITEFDAGWGNVVDIDLLNDRLQDIYNEIRDILATNPGDTAALQDKVNELKGIKAEYENSGFTPAYIAEQTAGIDGATDATVCYISSSGSSGARMVTGSCSAGDVETALDGAEGVQNSNKNPYFGDVFDSNGVFLASESERSINPDNNFIILKTPLYEYIPLRDFLLDSYEKTRLVAKIFTYYYTTLSYKGQS